MSEFDDQDQNKEQEDDITISATLSKEEAQQAIDDVGFDNIGANDYSQGIEDIMHISYLRYSLSVNVGRAIPDVRDGLKPGMRRILYAMKQAGFTKSHAHVKCAKVVGEVLGNYHPHGDSSVYDTMVRMAQDFSMRVPLIDGHGNFGSIDGDPAAAYRYTECRMERVAGELLQDIEKNTVDMVPNFDETLLEPTVLPARFPNLLVNGTTGIGVGMATNIPPHNLAETINATIKVIENPMVRVDELMEVIKGPDFPTGGMICGISGIRELYETGHGSITLRGKVTIENDEKRGKNRLIVNEIPYSVNKEKLVEKIADLVNDKVLTGISDITDESSSRTGIRIVIDLKRDADADVVLNMLFKHTQLQISIGAHFLVVDRNRPRVMPLRGLLQCYIDHRFEVITRRTRYELEKAEERDHILQGLITAANNIDEVVHIIRNSRTRDEAGERLRVRFELTPRQSTAILDMRLHQLTGLAIDELMKEHEELVLLIANLKDLLASREKLMEVVKNELIEVRDRYEDKRRTEISPYDSKMNVEDLIEKAVWVVTISEQGYVNRIREDEYRTQMRGGVGVKGGKTKNDDKIALVCSAKSHDFVVFISDFGQLYALKTYEIPEGNRGSKGKPINNFLRIAEGEHIHAILSTPKLDDQEHHLFMATQKGVIKKTVLAKYKNIRSSKKTLLDGAGSLKGDNRFRGIRAITLEEDDKLIAAMIATDEQQILLSSSKGQACRFRGTDIRPVGRSARGVRGMNLKAKVAGTADDILVAMTPINDESEILVVTANGMGKRSAVGTGIPDENGKNSGYRLTKRGGRGVRSIVLSDNDYVVAVINLKDENGVLEEDVLIMAVSGMMVRIRISDIRVIGRASKGVKVMKLRAGDLVRSVSIFAKLSDDELSEMGVETAQIEDNGPEEDEVIEDDNNDEDDNDVEDDVDDADQGEDDEN